MKGYLTSYAGLFGEKPGNTPTIEHIEIPLIQRDYAQGRTGPVVQEIRTSFIEALLRAVDGGPAQGLDFIYGKVEKETLQPLDGQQRLTTLFLLHWYLASLANEHQPNAPWTRFSYATRPSARRFCEQLTRNPLPADTNTHTPSDWIKDQSWFLYQWAADPTIRSMLVVIDALHQQITERHPNLDPQHAWQHLTHPNNPAVFFYVLPLEDLQSEEDLYIKMNSRGKPLTDFEHFKARFEQVLQHSTWTDNEGNTRAKSFAHKIDGPWSDLFLKFHTGDHQVDDHFARYIDFLTEICECRDGRPTSGNSLRRATATFGETNANSEDHLDCLFAAFETWADPKDIANTFEDLFSDALPDSATYDPDKLILFGDTTTNLFEHCLSEFHSEPKGARPFRIQSSLLLHAVLLHHEENLPHFRKRLRVLRNLITSPGSDVRRDRMPMMVRATQDFIRTGDLDTAAQVSTNQIHDERRKRDFLTAHPELTSDLRKLEDHTLLQGTLTAFEFDPDTFSHRAAAFHGAFGNAEDRTDTTGALLATGDYQQERPQKDSWQFGTSSETHDSVWRGLFTTGTFESLAGTREVLGEFLDSVAASTTTTSITCQQLITDSVASREAASNLDWRYYLIKYPAMRSGITGIYFAEGTELDYRMCMLRTVQRNGDYRDPILLQIWLTSGAEHRTVDPWFTGYETVPRWLRLTNSGVGIRNINEGFQLEGPDAPDLRAIFAAVCKANGNISDDLLAIPQHGGVDTADRVAIGAEFLQQLLKTGL